MPGNLVQYNGTSPSVMGILVNFQLTTIYWAPDSMEGVMDKNTVFAYGQEMEKYLRINE